VNSHAGLGWRGLKHAAVPVIDSVATDNDLAANIRRIAP
jgi:hypothetical protein